VLLCVDLVPEKLLLYGDVRQGAGEFVRGLEIVWFLKQIAS